MIQIPHDREDASVFNKTQIYFFKKHDKARFKSLDVTFCDDVFIRELFPCRKAVSSVSTDDIPYIVKKSYFDIIRFRELSRDARMQIQRDADIELSKLMVELKIVHPKTSCMMLSKHLFLSTVDKCDACKKDEIVQGYDTLLRVGIRNRAEAVGHMRSEDRFLKDKNGDPAILTKHIHSGKNNSSMYINFCIFSHLHIIYIIQGTIKTISYSVELIVAIQTNDDIICESCASVKNILRKRCIERANFLNKPLTKNTSLCHILSTPSKVYEYAQNNTKQRKKDYDKNIYLASQKKRPRDHGVAVSMGSSGNFINADIFKKGQTYLDGKKDTISQPE